MPDPVATATAVAAAVEGSGGIHELMKSIVIVVIPVITPVIVAGFKKVAARIPANIIPIIAPIIGAVFGGVGSMLGIPGFDANMVNGVIGGTALGAAGVGVREIVSKNFLKPTAEAPKPLV
jgi:hypothetical protein